MRAMISKTRMYLILIVTLSSVSGTTLFYNSLSAYPLALCNNGEAASVYDQAPASATEFFIQIGGGGFCATKESCQTRCEDTTSPLFRDCGSTTRPQFEAIRGLLSDDPILNPTFHTFHKTSLPYCSSDFHTGNRTASSATGGYHFRGKEIFRAAIEYMKSNTGIANAKTVVLDGGSAGGFGVLSNCDFLRTLLPNVQDVKCMVEAAGFMPLHLAGEECPWDEDGVFYDYIPTFWNGIPNELCLAGTDPQMHKLCYYLEYALDFVTNPVFIVTSLFDPTYMPIICNYRLYNDTKKYFERWGSHMKSNAQHFDEKYPTWGLFMPGCYLHGLFRVPNYFTELLVGKEQLSLSQTLDNWLAQTGDYVVWDKCMGTSAPCSSKCDGIVPLPPGLKTKP